MKEAARGRPRIAAALLAGANVFLFQARSLLRHAEGAGFATAPDRYSAWRVDILPYGVLARTEGEALCIRNPD